jgi:hypothetical protein
MMGLCIACYALSDLFRLTSWAKVFSSRMEFQLGGSYLDVSVPTFISMNIEFLLSIILGMYQGTQLGYVPVRDACL